MAKVTAIRKTENSESSPARGKGYVRMPAEGENGLFTQSWFVVAFSSELGPGQVIGRDFLDGRIVGRGYGRVFLDTLPAGLPRTSAIEQVRRWFRSAP